MASSVGVKCFDSSNLLSSSLGPSVRVVSLPLSSFLNSDDAVDRSSDCRGVSSLSAKSSLSEILKEIIADSSTAADDGARASGNNPWRSKVTAAGVDMRMDMPGLGKEDVKVFLKGNNLVVEAEVKEFEGDESARKFTGGMEISEKLYKISDIKVEMKNGILKVFIPKIKEEERTDVLRINVD